MKTRFAPQRPFPPYAFLPGRDPHPTRDPRGHSYGHDEDGASYHEPEEWSANEDYLYGVDLYNHGYLWEAHEAWEGLWHKSKHDEDQAEFLQGLIQCAAACLKIPMEQPNGLVKLSGRGLGRIATVIGNRGPVYMGLDAVGFTEEFTEFVNSEPGSIEERPRIVLSGM